MEGQKAIHVLRGFYLASIMAGFFYACGVQAAGPTFIQTNSPITVSSTWAKVNSPYVIQGSGQLSVRANLNIEPGVVVKFQFLKSAGRFPGIFVNSGGKILALGTVAEPIIFTSYTDDSAAGDTNNDGAATTPLSGDWRSVWFDGDSSVLSHVEFRYGGYANLATAAVEIKNGSRMQIADSRIADSGTYGVSVAGGSAPQFARIVIERSSDVGIGLLDAGVGGSMADSVVRDGRKGAVILSSANAFIFQNCSFINNSLQTVEVKGKSIANDAVWPYLPGLTYVSFNLGKITVGATSTLTIDPGVTVKMFRTSGFFVKGNLRAVGSEMSPILFTSWKEDGVAGDWGGVYIDVGGSAIIENAILRYGGSFADNFSGISYGFVSRNVVDVQGGSLSLKNSIIQDGLDTGVYYFRGSGLEMVSTTVERTPRGADIISDVNVAVAGNQFASTSVFAMRMAGTGVMDARRNWWGSDSGPKVAANPGGVGGMIFGNILYDPWIGKSLTPVILIPGILGTEMKKGSELLWMDLARMAFDAGDDFMDPLAMNADGSAGDVGVGVGDVVRSKSYVLGNFNYLNILIDEFQKNGYTENNNLFVFPYDWRLDNSVNADKLRDKINQILTQTGAEKVDLVAHSMGGLIAKQYILDEGENKVDKLVFVGTPHLGAPKALKALVAGDNFGIPLVLNQLEMKKLGQNMSSVYQLLPSQNYFNQIGSYFFDADQNKLLDYVGTNQYLTSQGGNAALAANADAFHSSALDTWQAQSAQVFNIVGCNKPTIGQIVKRNHLYFLESGVYSEDEYDLTAVDGDSTVPLSSADAIGTFGRTVYAKNVDHGKMPSQDGVRQTIVSMVTGQYSTTSLQTNFTQDKNQCHWQGKKISVHSPVDIHVYDSVGNHLGQNPDGSFDENIDGVVYENINNNKFVFLPDNANQTYTVNLDATATGTFNLRVSELDGSSITETQYYERIPIVPQSVGTLFVVLSTTLPTLEFDSAGTGALATIPPTAVLDANSAEDVTKSVTTIQMDGTMGQQGWYRSAVTSQLSATDDVSGILRTEYSIDNGTTWQTYQTPITFGTDGATTILYRSLDRAGNREEPQSTTFTIDRISPEARLVFDPITKTSSIVGFDESSSTTQSNKSNAQRNMITTSISDLAGNTTTVGWQNILSPARNSVTGKFMFVSYGGGPMVIPPLATIATTWSENARRDITSINQTVVSTAWSKNLLAIYSASSNQTAWRTATGAAGRIQFIWPDMKLLFIQTNKGSLNFNF